MSISLVKQPAQWGRVYDTNVLTYQFTSTNWQQPNFQFQFVLLYWNTGGTSTNIGTFNVYPSPTGSVEFNPSSIYRNYISHDFNASSTSLEPCVNSMGQFSLTAYEYYGTPPTRKTEGAWAGEVGVNPPLKLYNGCQMPIPYDYIALNPKGNYKWVMSGVTSGQFLTDATEFHMDDDDLGFLYFICDTNSRPTRIRYTIYEPCSGVTVSDAIGYGGITKEVNYDGYTYQGLANDEIVLDDKAEPPTPSEARFCATSYFDTNITYASINHKMFYFPIGPYQVFNYLTITGHTNWAYYKVDILSGTTVFNAQTFVVWRKAKCNKYGVWRVHWLNPHGGFDNYTFDRAWDDVYKVKRTTYKQKLPLSSQFSFSTYNAGERVFNVDVEEQITLRSNSLTQKEAQLMGQLVKSPRVYVVKTYEYNGAKYFYGVPYIISQEDYTIQDKKKNKEIFTEITIRPANEGVISND